MASRHSRLALKGNTYTQIGLKVCYVGEVVGGGGAGSERDGERTGRGRRGGGIWTGSGRGADGLG